MVSEYKLDRRAKEIIFSLGNGMTREELAVKFDHNDYRSLDMYMRRRDYIWDTKQLNYTKKETKVEKMAVQEVHGGKVLQILELFNEGNDAKAVAKQLFFSDHRILANYMKNKGYQWNTDQNNYSRMSGLKIDENEYIHNSTTKAIAEQIPRYLIPGINQPKNINISHLLNQLVIEYSQEKNIRQREIFETAVVDFLKRYGYSHEIKALFEK